MGLFDVIFGDIGTELYSIYSMKKAIREAIPQASGGQPVQTKGGSLIFSRFTLDDTKAYAEVIARLETHPEGKKNVYSVSKWMKNNLSDWQKENFRIVVGHLMNKEYLIETKKETKEMPPAAPGDRPSKQETTREIKGNRGVDFFISFARCTDEEKMDICESTGLLSSPLETLKKTWRKVEDNQEEIIRGIQNLGKRIGGEDYQDSTGRIVKGTLYRGPIGEILEPWKKIWRSVFSRKKR